MSVCLNTYMMKFLLAHYFNICTSMILIRKEEVIAYGTMG